MACFPILLTTLLLWQARAQTSAVPATGFEAATIKPSRPDAEHGGISFRPNSVSIENFSVLLLIKWAYGLNKSSDDQIVGAPAWVRSAAFDINGKEDDATAKAIDKAQFEETQRIVGTLLRSLLEDRFQLKVHTEEQPRTVDVLTVAKGGSKLEPYSGCDPVVDHACHVQGLGLHNDGHGHIQGGNAALAMLVNMLPSQPDIGGRMVVDSTGLTGRYNFDLHYAPENAAAADGNGPSLFTALQEQLGLKLETKKIPIKVLVIDHIEQPSPN